MEIARFIRLFTEVSVMPRNDGTGPDGKGPKKDGKGVPKRDGSGGRRRDGRNCPRGKKKGK